MLDIDPGFGMSLFILISATFLVVRQQKEYKKLSQYFSKLQANSEVIKCEFDELKIDHDTLEIASKTLNAALAEAHEVNRKILSQKKSSETRLGQITEHLAPLLDQFPYDPKSLHFLGDPIDFISFDLHSADPAVVFIEVKSGNSKLSSRQRLIKKLVEKGSIRFEELRVSADGIKFGSKPSTNKRNKK